MAKTFGDLDWRDKPNCSPTSGALLQSRVGKIGDFHVVVPWMNGSGLVHWSRDNFRADQPWSGGTMFGDGVYTGSALAETDYTSHPPTTVKNLDCVAVTADGRVELWQRECGGAFRWSLLMVFTAGDGHGVPSLSYGGSCFETGPAGLGFESHGIGGDVVAFPSKTAGVQFWWSQHGDKDRDWFDVRTFYKLQTMQKTTLAEYDPRPIAGVSAAMIVDRESAISQPAWRDVNQSHSAVYPTVLAFATVYADGGITVFYAGLGRYGPVADAQWSHDMTIYESVALSRTRPGGVVDATPVRGSPCVFQSSYLLQETPPNGVPLVLVKSPQVGDLVVMAPAKDGGILFWIKNFGDYNDPRGFEEGWNFEYVIGSEIYDQVAVIQGNFLHDGNEFHNLEITARRADRQGFDQYWADWKGNWGGPLHVLGEVIGTIQQALVTPSTTLPASAPGAPPPASPPFPTDPLAALAAIGIDYSVSEAQLREWLADAAFTPYPALATALNAIIRPGRLAKPVEIDVVRGFYEDDQGQKSPRAAGDVDLDQLRLAVVAASDQRYGGRAASFAALVIGA